MRPPRSTVALTPEKIAELDGDRNSDAARALRLFRTAVSANSPYNRLPQLWSAGEILAKQLAQADDNRVERTCEKCQVSTKEDFRTQPYMEAFFGELVKKDEGQREPRALAAAVRKSRNTLVHGGKLHSWELVREVSQHIGALQGAVSIPLMKELRSTPATRFGSAFAQPLLIAELVAQECMMDQNAATEFKDHCFGKWLVLAAGAFPRIPERYVPGEDVSGIKLPGVGLTFPMAIPNLCFPSIVAI
jgi:hypothetical protein